MASYPHWTLVLETLGGTKIGEVLDAAEKQIVRSLSVPSTATFKILATNRLLSELFNRDLNLLAYRDGSLVFHGPILTTQFAAEDPTGTPTVVVTAADPSWRFTKRIVGQTNLGTSYSAGTDRLTVAENLIAQANTNGRTGVKTLGLTCGTALAGTYVAGPYKMLSECITEMGNTLAGFDWRIDPIEYSGVNSEIGEFRAAAILGLQRPNAVFEYQGKANARSPNYIKSVETVVNKAYSIPDGGPADIGGVLTDSSSGSQSTRGLFEEVIDTSGLVNIGLRQAVVNDHVFYRAAPRQTMTFQPDIDDGSGRVPRFLTDYNVGDYVRARILYNDVSLVDGTVRLYKVQFDIDNSERETVTPTLVQDGTA